MSRWARWTEDELMRLGFLIQAGFTNPEIAKMLRKPKSGVQIKAYRVWGGNPNYLRKKTKHAHLREPVMRYFLKHTWEETREKFGLTQSELKSLFTVGYKIPDLRHLRKDTRRRDSWSTKELKFLLRHAGLQPRSCIANELNRGSSVCIKERLQVLGLCSRTLQGITLSQFRLAFGKDPSFYLRTKAGPSRESVSAPTLWKIVPWVWLADELRAKRLKAPKLFRQLVYTQALFQDWIFEGNALKKMKRICKGAA